MKRIITTISAIFATLSLAEAVQYEVLQGGTVLGNITPYSGASTAAANYGLSGGEANLSVPGNSILAPNQGTLFLYSGSDGLSLFTVFSDTVNGAPGNGDAEWNFTYTGTGDPSVLVSDDSSGAGELREIGGNSDFFRGRWNWNNSHTDGGVIGDLGSGLWDIDIDLNVRPNNFHGNDTVSAIKAFGANGEEITFASGNNAANITIRAVPESSASIVFLGLGLLFCGFSKRLLKK